jgi:hypothetical protein
VCQNLPILDCGGVRHCMMKRGLDAYTLACGFGVLMVCICENNQPVYSGIVWYLEGLGTSSPLHYYCIISDKSLVCVYGVAWVQSNMGGFSSYH